MNAFLRIFLITLICFVSIFGFVSWLSSSLRNYRAPNLEPGFAGETLVPNFERVKLESLSLSKDGRRGVYLDEASNVTLWQEEQGSSTLAKDGLGQPQISESGERIAFLQGSELILWEEGFGVQALVSTIEGDWEIEFSGNANRIALVPKTGSARISSHPQDTSFLVELGSRFPDTGLKRRLPLSELPIELKPLNSDAQLLALQSNLAVLQKLKAKTTRATVKSSFVGADVDGDGASDLLTFSGGKELPFWRAYTTSGYEGAVKSPAGRVGEVHTWRVGDNLGVPVPGDYNGDGILDFATYTPRYSMDWTDSHGNWRIYLSDSSDLRKSNPLGEYLDFSWGLNHMVAVPADYDGDGATDLAVFDMKSQGWHFVYSKGGFHLAKAELRKEGYGAGIPFSIKGGAIPVVADYSGDGKANLALYQAPSKWKIRLSSKKHLEFSLGEAGDIAHPLDYNCDGKAEPGIYRPLKGEWYFRYADDDIMRIRFGDPGEGYPISGDFDGDGCPDLALFYPSRPASDHWHFLPSSFTEDAKDKIPSSKNIDVRFVWVSDKPAQILLREHYLTAK